MNEVPKKLRFRIFERDNFTCQYCGRTPPLVVLHVDHMISKKDGGQNDEINLITSCSDCNLGKSSKSVDLQKIKNKNFKKEIKLLEEKKNQLEAYYFFIKRKGEIDLDEMNIFQKCWEDCSDGENSLTKKGLMDIKKLSERYASEMIFNAIKISFDNSRIPSDSKFRYMCGVLKNLKSQSEDTDLPII